MTDEEIEDNLGFIRGMNMIERMDDVSYLVRLWNSVGSMPTMGSPVPEMILGRPWNFGLDTSI